MSATVTICIELAIIFVLAWLWRRESNARLTAFLEGWDERHSLEKRRASARGRHARKCQLEQRRQREDGA